MPKTRIFNKNIKMNNNIAIIMYVAKCIIINNNNNFKLIIIYVPLFSLVDKPDEIVPI